MTWAMLGPGNLLMLAGWWVDAGFGPVMREGVCLCCQSHRCFEVGWKVPWMWVGMVVGGLPWMWRSSPDLGSGGRESVGGRRPECCGHDGWDEPWR